MCATYNVKVYHPEDRSFHQVAHQVTKDECNNLVSLIERHHKSVLIQFNFEEVEESHIDWFKLLTLGISKLNA